LPELKYLSLFSGIEAATVAWEPLGWKPLAFAEIETFPSALLAHRYPDTPNLGNVQEADFDGLEPDLIVFGSPCQSFSVAGKRLGMDDPRGNLALVALSIIGRLGPRWFLFENVPGLFSSGGRRDFGQFLGAVDELGYSGAWRVLDAQYFGVPQRRRRIFFVGHSGDWRRAAAVLFERESLSGNPSPRRETGEGFTRDLAPCIGASGRGFERTGDTRGQDAVVATLCGNGEGPGITRDLSDALLARCVTSGEGKRQDYETCTIIPTVMALQANMVDRSETAGCNGKGWREGVGYTHDTVGMQAVAFTQNHDQAVFESEVHPALNTGGGKPGQGYPAIREKMQVRRLTPRECERLQGFPDDYTRIPYRNKPAEDCPDGPRYKALGNSMAVPVMRWIGERIAKVEGIAR